MILNKKTIFWPLSSVDESGLELVLLVSSGTFSSSPNVKFAITVYAFTISCYSYSLSHTLTHTHTFSRSLFFYFVGTLHSVETDKWTNGQIDKQQTNETSAKTDRQLKVKWYQSKKDRSWNDFLLKKCWLIICSFPLFCKKKWERVKMLLGSQNLVEINTARQTFFFCGRWELSGHNFFVLTFLKLEL